MNRGEEGVGIPGITGGDAPPALEMQKSILNQMPQTVEIPVMLPWLPAIALRRNHRFHPLLGAVRHNGIGVVSPIHQQDARIDPFQQPFPNPLVPLTAEAPMGVLPVAVIRRQVPPRRPATKNPEHRIEETPIVLGDPSPLVSSTGQMRLQQGPYVVRNIVSTMGISHLSRPKGLLPSIIPYIDLFL